MDECIRVLLLEDSKDDAELIEIELKRARIKYYLLRVDTRKDFLEAIDEMKPDIIISDYQLPGFDGRTALDMTRVLAPSVPFIMVTGSVNEDVAIECIRSGARDYVIKEHLDRLGLAVISAIEYSRFVDKLNQSYQQLQRNFIMIVETMSKVVELRDPYTAGHQKRVAQLAGRIGKKMELPESQIEGIIMAGMIHDIGKISVPSEILCKPGKLNDAEMTLIRMHPEIGANILESIEFPWPVAKIIIQHHEKMNGSGYGKGLMESEIILEARILCVADVVEAIASHRPYRPALGIDAALSEIYENSGKLYDKEVVKVCNELFLSKEFAF